MIGLTSRSTANTLSLLGLLAGLAAANAARADEATAFGCRAEDQGGEMVSDCDQDIQEAKVKTKTPVIPPPTDDPIYLILSVEGGKHDHDHDPGGEGTGGRDAGARPR